MFAQVETCYQRLQEPQDFRLLTIQRGHACDELQCHLWHASLDSTAIPSWETISYCWGSPHQRVPLAVNGQAVLVPSNARDAIIRLRLKDQDRVVWIDSVCINQANLEERSMQVARMGLIYRKAVGNLIYLGHSHASSTESVITALRNVADRIRHARLQLSRNQEMSFMTGLVPSDWLATGVVRPEEMSVLAPLYESPWFQRLWVVQEASLSKENLCFWGASSFSLEDALLSASINTRPIEFGMESRKGFFAAAAMRQFVVSSPQALDIGGQLFQRYRSLIRTMVTTDPRDRVFAILDLYRHRAGLDSIPSLLCPDYQKPISHVFRDATRYALQESASSGLLSDICHRSEADMYGTPYTSWTKKFDRQFSPSEDCVNLRSASATFPPESVDHRLEIAHSEDSNVLTLRGWVIGHLTWSSGIASTPQFRSLEYGTAKSLVDAVFARSVTVAAYQTFGMDDEYSLAAGILSTGVLGNSEVQFNDISSRRDAFFYYLEYIYGRETVPPSSATVAADEKTALAIKFHSLFSTQIHRRRCFQLDKGHIGTGPGILREGDVLVICNGAGHPYVLRPDGSGYHFIGAAYVPGLMAGQVFHLGLESTWFNIR